MAKLDGNLSFIGSLGNLSVYKMKGVVKPVMRTKGGASKEKIKKSPVFKMTRRLNSEWSGCSKAGKNIRLALSPLKHLADYNISGTLTGLAKTIQKSDTTGRLGERSILISRYCHSLEGFSLNTKTGFDGVIRQPVTTTVSREELSATLLLPDLIPGLNFYIPGRLPLFRIIAVLGVVPDMVWTPLVYQPANMETRLYHVSAATVWASTATRFPGQSLELNLPKDAGLDGNSSLMLSAGVEFGMPVSDTVVNPIRNAGCARIFALV
jgi:hypothetical protein